MFDFYTGCFQAFNTLKEAVINALIMNNLYWTKPFEVVCDASDYASRR